MEFREALILQSMESFLPVDAVKMCYQAAFGPKHMLERENEAIVRQFIDEHDQFVLEKLELPGPVGEVEEGYVTLWPHLHGTDGFFIAKLRRKA